MRYLTIVLPLAAALLSGCDRDPVDRELVGSWQTAIASPAGAWQLRFTTLSNGQYRTDFQGPFAVAPETGYFTAEDGEWRLEKITGSTDAGTYEFLTADSLLFQSAAGAVVWTRLPADGVAPDAAASEPFAPTLAPAGGIAAANGAAPSAALLATGPFGTALQPPSGAAAPAAAPFGAAPTAAQASSLAVPGGAQPPPAGFGVPTAAATGFGAPNGFGAAPSEAAPQNIETAIGGVAQQLGSDVRALRDASSQAASDVRGSAEQAAAGAIDQAAAPAAEAADEASRKVGRRIQTFSGNAASRVRNFFTRDRDRGNDDGDADDDAAAEAEDP